MSPELAFQLHTADAAELQSRARRYDLARQATADQAADHWSPRHWFGRVVYRRREKAYPESAVVDARSFG
jgi:hypothetical protein